MLIFKKSLGLVETSLPASTSHFELTAVSTDLWACLGVVITGSGTEVTDGFTTLAVAFKKDALLASWAEESKLIEGHALTTSSDDTATSNLGELEGANLHAWDDKKTLVIDDLANDDGDGFGILLLEGGGKTGKGVWTTVGPGDAKAMSNLTIEIVTSAASEERVKVVEHLHVDIISLRLLPDLAGDSVININTHL